MPSTKAKTTNMAFANANVFADLEDHAVAEQLEDGRRTLQKLQRKEDKKQRQRAAAAAKELADAAAKQAEEERAAAKKQAVAAAREAARTRPAAICIQCAARRFKARRCCNELRRRKLQAKRRAAWWNWGRLLIWTFRDVEGLRRLLRAANPALMKKPAAQAEEAPTGRPVSLKAALHAGNWTKIRDSNHYVVRRKVLKTSGRWETQTQTLAKTPSDHRSVPNQLAELRRHDEGVTRSCLISCAEEECLAAAVVDLRLHDPEECADARTDDDRASPQVLIVRATLMAFQKSMADYCWTFTQRKRALAILKAELKTLKTLERKRLSTALTPEEQREREALEHGCRIEDKCKWLRKEMELMMARGELTADEQQQQAEIFQEKLKGYDEEAKRAGPSSKAAESATALRGKLETLRASKPFVWKPRRAEEIKAIETSLAELAKLESPKEPLPLKEVMELNKKPGLLAQLAEVRADSRGWFADD